ncbi:MAG: hypothetical protein V3U40_02560, partial [Candidatus Scalindua sediminis]
MNTIKLFVSSTPKNLHLRIAFTLFLIIFFIALASSTSMAQENAETAEVAETVEAAEPEAPAEPYEVVDYRNFFGLDGRLAIWIIAQLHLM